MADDFGIATPSRRGFIAGGGALIVSFSMLPRALAQTAPATPPLPGSLRVAPFLDSWIRVNADGSIGVMSGKAARGGKPVKVIWWYSPVRQPGP